jgi:hypothetical protein
MTRAKRATGIPWMLLRGELELAELFTGDIQAAQKGDAR